MLSTKVIESSYDTIIVMQNWEKLFKESHILFLF